MGGCPTIGTAGVASWTTNRPSSRPVVHSFDLPLSVDGKVLVLHVELDEGLAGVQAIPALEGAWVNPWVGGRLDVARLQAAITELSLAIGAAGARREILQLKVPPCNSGRRRGGVEVVVAAATGWSVAFVASSLRVRVVEK